MGDLGLDQTEQLDRNMWAPEEEKEEEAQVCRHFVMSFNADLLVNVC